MKRSVLFAFGMIISIFSPGCEPEPNDGINDMVKQPGPVSQDTTSIPENPQEPPYDWRMVVKSVDSFAGDTSNIAFKDILLGNTLPNGITTTNTTFFRMDPNGNEVELKLVHSGWTLWEAYGFYPILWDFKYLKASDTLELEGLANMGLSICELPEGSTLINRFYFKGIADEKIIEKYVGRYIWSETFENGTCVWIEGKMEVFKDLNYYPVF